MIQKKENQFKTNKCNNIFEKDDFGIFDIFLVLAKQIKIILGVTIFFSILAIVYAQFFTKPIYISNSKIMSSNSTSQSQIGGLAAQFGVSLPVMSQSQPKWVYPDILKSRTLAKLLLKKKFNSNEFGSQKTLLQILTYGNNQPLLGLDTLEIQAISQLSDMIHIFEDRTTKMLTLSVSAYEAKLSMEINNGLIEALDAHQKEYNKLRTSQTRYFIEGRIIEAEKKLKKSEENLKVFLDRNRRIENSPALQLEQQRLTRETTVLIGVFTTLKQQLEMTEIEEVKESDYVIILDLPNIPLSPSKPKKRQIVYLATLMGFFSGIFIGFIKQYYLEISTNHKEKFRLILSEIRRNIM